MHGSPIQRPFNFITIWQLRLLRVVHTILDRWMRVCTVLPIDNEISPGDIRIPARAAGLSPANATTLQSVVNPYLSTK